MCHLFASQKGSPDFGISSLDACNPAQKDTHFHTHMQIVIRLRLNARHDWHETPT